MENTYSSLKDRLNNESFTEKCFSKLSKLSIQDVYGKYPGALVKLLEMQVKDKNFDYIRGTDPLPYIIRTFDASTDQAINYQKSNNSSLQREASRFLLIPFHAGDLISDLFSMTPDNVYNFIKSHGYNDLLNDNAELYTLLLNYRNKPLTDIIFKMEDTENYEILTDAIWVVFSTLLAHMNGMDIEKNFDSSNNIICKEEKELAPTKFIPLKARLSGKEYAKNRYNSLVNMKIKDYFEGFENEMKTLLSLPVSKINHLSEESYMSDLSKNIIPNQENFSFISHLSYKKKEQIECLTYYPITHEGPMRKFFDMSLSDYLDFFDIYIPYYIYDSEEYEDCFYKNRRMNISQLLTFNQDFFHGDLRNARTKCLTDCLLSSINQYRKYLNVKDKSLLLNVSFDDEVIEADDEFEYYDPMYDEELPFN